MPAVAFGPRQSGENLISVVVAVIVSVKSHIILAYTKPTPGAELLVVL